MTAISVKVMLMKNDRYFCQKEMVMKMTIISFNGDGDENGRYFCQKRWC